MRKTALITGASRGLGAVLARFLAAQGYDLILTARGVNGLASLSRELARLGTTIHDIAGDIADANHRLQLIQAAERQGRLDLLVNNASGLGPSPLPALVDFSLADLERLFQVNALAPLGLIQLAIPLLEKSGGLIVNISSDAAVGGYPGWGGYGSTKAALDLITRTLANELRPSGISVVSVDPGDMRTEMHQRAFPGEDISDRPLPEVSLPFWAWLLGQEREEINGTRFEAQAETWELAT